MSIRAIKAAQARERRQHEKALLMVDRAIMIGAAHPIENGFRKSGAVPPLPFELDIAKHNLRVSRREPTWPIRASVRRALYSRDNNRCYYCGAEDWLTLDHKVPQSAGGSNHSSNLVTACKYCNSAKGAKHIIDFIHHRFSGDAA